MALNVNKLKGTWFLNGKARVVMTNIMVFLLINLLKIPL